MAGSASVSDWLVDTIDRPIDDRETSFRATERAVRDLISVAIRGNAQESVAVAQAVVRETAGPGESWIWTNGRHVDPISAALVNGTAAQALDYDDVSPKSVSHLSSVMVPGLFALAGRIEVSQQVEALALGYCVVERLANLMGRPAYNRGLQPTHTLGAIGAVAAMLRGIDASPEVSQAAFSLVASQLIGLRAHSGTMYKATQSGVAAAGAVRAVLLASAGMRAGKDALGDVLTLLGAETDPGLVDSDEPFAPTHLGVKFYPTCGAAHTPIEVTLQVRGELDAASRAASTLTVFGPERIFRHMHFGVPKSPDEARFSMAYCVADAWVRGEVVPEHFTNEAIKDPEIVELIGKLEFVDDLTMAPNGDEAITEASGPFGSVSRRVDHRLGYPMRVPTDEQMRDKFVFCLTPILGDKESALLYERAQGETVFTELEKTLSTAAVV